MDPAPPGSALVLLLLAVPPPGACCSFEFNPVSSTVRAHVEAVTPWLLLDYTVEMPENLELGSPCSPLWTLRFALEALLRLAARAGGALSPRLRALAAQLHFLSRCPISDPQGCARLRPMNVSQLLGVLELHLGGLRERPPPPHACTHLRCTRAPSVSAPPAAPHGVSPPAPHGLVLWGAVGGALVLSAAAWGLSVRRRRGGTECSAGAGRDLSGCGGGPGMDPG